LGAIAVALSALTASRMAAQEDVARMLKQQTQELFDAVSSGDARVWDRYLDANAINLSEDGVRKTRADLSAIDGRARHGIRRPPRRTGCTVDA